MRQRCPDGVDAARWNEDGERDELRCYVVQHLGDERAVLVVDETGS
jgi:SRSO17 transposase